MGAPITARKSVLHPHRNEIMQHRRQGDTYETIRAIIESDYNIQMGLTGVISFISRENKKGKYNDTEREITRTIEN